MADFFQNGVICTLQKLRERPIDELEDELRAFTKRQKAVLLLPALYSEFEKPSMLQIVEELKGADYLHRIVLSLDRADASQFARVREIMSAIPVEVSILWNDGPRIREVLQTIEDADFVVAEQGKGRGVWLSMGYALADKDVYSIALHDCDIVNYKRELLSRLMYPIAHPATDFEYAKGYYARVTNKLFGRVTRLFYTPFVRALRRIELPGAERYLRYMDSFRYALSGEFAFIRSLAKSVRISPGWGLEVSMLSEVFDQTTVQRVCQVEVTDFYEHKHQVLSRNDLRKGLTRMSGDIARAMFRVLAQGGVVLSPAFFNTLLATYTQQAKQAIEQYHSVALLNGLKYDRHEEVAAVEAFVRSLRESQKSYLSNPFDAALLSAWVRLRAGLPQLTDMLTEAVELDNAGTPARS